MDELVHDLGWRGSVLVRQSGADHVSLAFMGDGATNHGMFHEGVNFAAVFDLPAVFVVENNQYGEFTPLASHARVPRLAVRSTAYGIPGVCIDGNDVWAVYLAVREAAERARSGEGPTLVECFTYRWHGHMEGDDMAYGPQGEMEQWKERDPIVPSTPLDAKGLLKAAIRSSNPVIFFENKLLYLEVGEIPDGDSLVPIGVADVKRRGSDVTVVAIGGMVSLALEAAEALAGEGIEVEVIDPRTLVPLDFATILESVVKTGRLVTVEEAALTHGFGCEVIARVVEVAPGLLKAAAHRVAGRDIPIGYARKLERAALPDCEAICEAVRGVVAGIRKTPTPGIAK